MPLWRHGQAQGLGWNVYTPQDFGAKGDGSQDDYPAIQAMDDRAAITKATCYFPAGLYRVNTGFQINHRGTKWIGARGTRATDGGSEIRYFGGPGTVVQIGTDNGQPWNANIYDGFQGQEFEELWFSVDSSRWNGALNSLNGTLHYAVGTVGMRDWRGGDIRLKRVGFEDFEIGWFGVQSDINYFENLTALYCKTGVYAGPRSDQFSIQNAYTFFCDTFLRIDGCVQFRLIDAQIVGCGSPTDYAIDVLKGSTCPRIVRPWFEHLQGYIGVDCLAYIGAGINDGYGGNTTPAKGLYVDQIFMYHSGIGQPYHIKYLVELGACLDVRIVNINTPPGVGYNLDTIIHSPVGTAYTSAQSTAILQDHSLINSDISSDNTRYYINDGTGTPDVVAHYEGFNGAGIIDTDGRWFVAKRGAATTARNVFIGNEGAAGWVVWSNPQYTAGTTDRLTLKRSIQTVTRPWTPTGTHQAGDIVFYDNPIAGGKAGMQCVTAGTPGTWKEFGPLDP